MTDYTRAAKIMSLLVLVVGTLVLGMGIGTSAGVLVTADGCEFQPEGLNAAGVEEPPACQEHAEQLSVWADCMYASGFFLLVVGLGGLLYIQYATASEPAEGSA